MAAPACETANPEDGANEGDFRWKLIGSVWEWQIFKGGKWIVVHDQFSQWDDARIYWEDQGFEWDEKLQVWLKDGQTPEEKGYDVQIKASSLSNPISDEDSDWDSDIWNED